MIPLGLKPHTVTFAARSGVDGNGDPTYGSTSTLRARVERTSKLVRRPDGKDVQAQFKMATDERAVRYDDMFWLPSIRGEPATTPGDATTGKLPDYVEGATDALGMRGFCEVYFA